MSVLRRTITGTSIGVGAASALWLDSRWGDGWLLWAMAGALAVGLAVEVARMSRGAGPPATGALLTSVVLVQVVAILIDVGVLALPGGAPLSYGALCLVAAALAGLLGGGRRSVLMQAVWIGPPLGAMALLTREHGHGALAVLIVLSKVGDVAGYYVGRKLGRTRPFPTISPGKTTAGCVASLVTTAFVALLLERGGVGEFTGPLMALLAGVVINLFAQSGDLLESAVKRRYQVKDSGTWMGASGGLLDVLDSFLLTAPLAWICS